MNLDREGIFKARPVAWFIRQSENTQSVAVVIEYLVTAQLVDGDWLDWTQYEPHKVWGNHFVVKRDGSANVSTVKQLAEAIGWRGSLKQITDETPPDCIVQVAVKPNVYEGKTTYRVEWVNPEDYVPTGGGASTDAVDKLELRFGALLRAAAGPAKAKPAPKPATPPKPPQTPPEAAAINPDDIPF